MQLPVRVMMEKIKLFFRVYLGGIKDPREQKWALYAALSASGVWSSTVSIAEAEANSVEAEWSVQSLEL